MTRDKVSVKGTSLAADNALFRIRETVMDISGKINSQKRECFLIFDTLASVQLVTKSTHGWVFS